MTITESSHPARYFHSLPDGRIQCDLCPRDCKLADGQRGLCFVRQNLGGHMILTTYGRSSGFCVDPIEKKPLAHFYPGSSVLSFGTAGCNLSCKFCQNWDISKSKEMDRLSDQASPDQIARAAVAKGAMSVAFTYNDPVIFAEYAMDTADACKQAGIKTVTVTAGYIHKEPRADFFAKMDAANVDLKGFSEQFYMRLTASHLQPVLETLEYLVQKTSVWTEITTLLIPGFNDSDEEITRLSEWVASKLRPDVPLHFSAFHPDYKMMNVPPTRPETLQRARATARRVGLKHVYTGNVHDVEGDTTICAGCGESLIVRDYYQILSYRLDPSAGCPRCGQKLAGHFAAKAGDFGRRRLPVRISAF